MPDGSIKDVPLEELKVNDYILLSLQKKFLPMVL